MINANQKTANTFGPLAAVMLSFFAMGFVDLVGIASNYVQADLGLTDAQANVFPSLVFFWFLIFSVPTGLLMNRIGRKHTVELSLVLTALSLLLPVFGDSYGLMLCSFSLLGIGNALMQTSLNPLLSNIIRGERLASALTFGQFVKAIASFLAPYIAMWGATQAIPAFGLGPCFRFRLACIVPHLHDCSRTGHISPVGHQHSGRTSRPGLGICRLLQSVAPPTHSLVFFRHRLSCRH